MKVALMITCLGDIFRPEVGVATVRLLRRLGVSVQFPAAQTCCGQPFFNSGYPRHAQDVARHTIEVFRRVPVDFVVVPSGSCAAMVKVEYPELFHDDPVWRGRAVELARRTHELTDLLVNVLGREDVGASFRGKVTYHYACHLRALGLKDEAVRLIRAIEGTEYVPLDGIEDCCGFGGSFAVRFPEISGAIVNDKAQAILRTGAEVVVATDSGCLMNIAGRLHRIGASVRTMHLVELLAP
ncbi:MAG: (Fe-S)-binding protein [Planctomycetes bacterium]|nr:(Fe-S)-binding protein [Planctomycetota bacterium]